MLIDRYPVEDVFARVPEVATQTDPVLKTLDTLLEDDQLYQAVRTDLGKRYEHTLVHGRRSTPVEVILRLLLIKHLYGWRYEETTRRVADSLVLRWFCRGYFQVVPTKATLIRWTRTLRPETLHELNDRVVQLAVQAKVTEGRKLRLDATCVQTETHHPTDSGLLVDSVRVLSRVVRRAKEALSDTHTPPFRTGRALGFQRTLGANVFGKMNDPTGQKGHFLFRWTANDLPFPIQRKRLLGKALPLANRPGFAIDLQFIC